MEAVRYCNMEFTDGVAGLESRPPLADGGTRNEHGWCTWVREFARHLKCCWMAVVFWSSVQILVLGSRTGGNDIEPASRSRRSGRG